MSIEDLDYDTQEDTDRPITSTRTGTQIFSYHLYTVELLNQLFIDPNNVSLLNDAKNDIELKDIVNSRDKRESIVKHLVVIIRKIMVRGNVDQVQQLLQKITSSELLQKIRAQYKTELEKFYKNTKILLNNIIINEDYTLEEIQFQNFIDGILRKDINISELDDYEIREQLGQYISVIKYIQNIRDERPTNFNMRYNGWPDFIMWKLIYIHATAKLLPFIQQRQQEIIALEARGREDMVRKARGSIQQVKRRQSIQEPWNIQEAQRSSQKNNAEIYMERLREIREKIFACQGKVSNRHSFSGTNVQNKIYPYLEDINSKIYALLDAISKIEIQILTTKMRNIGKLLSNSIYISIKERLDAIDNEVDAMCEPIDEQIKKYISLPSITGGVSENVKRLLENELKMLSNYYFAHEVNVEKEDMCTEARYILERWRETHGIDTRYNINCNMVSIGETYVVTFELSRI